MKKIILAFAVLMMSVGMAEARGRHYNPIVPAPGYGAQPQYRYDRVPLAPAPGFQFQFNFGGNSGTYGSPFRGGRTYKYKCRQVQGYGHVVRHRIRYKALIVATQCYDRWGRGYIVPGSSRVVRIIGNRFPNMDKHPGRRYKRGGKQRYR